MFLHVSHIKLSLQILGDITSNLDAKKACTEALKIQKKYLSKVSFILSSLAVFRKNKEFFVENKWFSLILKF